MKAPLLTLLLASTLAHPALAVSYNQNITAIFGSGNPNTGWTVDTANGIQLGMRAKARNDTANPSTTPNNGAGTYLFPVFQGARGPFNYEFSINSDTSGGGAPLSTYDFYLAADGDPSQCINYGLVAPLVHWGDNSFGDNGTANGAGVEPADLSQYQNFPAQYNVAQNSQNITFADYPGGVLAAPGPADATYNFELFAVAKGTGPGGTRLASVGITVVVGVGGAAGACDSVCPIVVNILPTLVPINSAFTLTAKVDDTTTGAHVITSTTYSIDGGSSIAMDAADGAFDEAAEDVQASVAAFVSPGVYNFCVTGTDSAGNACSECILLAVYDPNAGFVTGGGWIDSPAGAIVGPDVWQVKWDQPFDSSTAGWLDGNSAWYGTITALPDGTALVEGDSNSGPFSRFDGFHSAWPGTWRAEIDVYLDPASLAAGEGFDYSVAASGSDGAHQRDYIFHVTKDTSTGKLLVAGSNNSNFAPREDLDTLANHYEVTTAGWYTLQHLFYDEGGYLAVDLNLLDSVGQIVFTETRATVTDTIPGEVGGNRYAWFTHVTVAGGIVVDDHQRFEFPTGKASFGFVSKYKKGASVPDGSTEFVFKAAGLNFHSSSYQWLVVNNSGQNAQFKGDGTINSGGNYGFMIWGYDGAKTATPDTFRIRIWDKDNADAIVYDNGTDQVLGGGNIMVHTSKK